MFKRSSTTVPLQQTNFSKFRRGAPAPVQRKPFILPTQPDPHKYAIMVKVTRADGKTVWKRACQCATTAEARSLAEQYAKAGYPAEIMISAELTAFEWPA